MVIDLLASPRLASYDLSSLATSAAAARPCRRPWPRGCKELYGLRLCEGYGLTETAAPTHINPPERPKQQCLGIPIMSTDARVVDPDTLQELPQGEQGEIIMHGPQVFKGYWKRPEATEAAFIELTASASSAPATWGAWTRTATSS
jgi:fatty-acyl-CoA synthase